MKYPANNRIQQGFSMIEILISMVIIASSLLGFAKLQLLNSQNYNDAYAKTQATMYIGEMISILHANKAFARNQQFNFGLSDLNALQSLRTSSSPSKQKIYAWVSDIDHSLPGAQAGVYCDTDYVCAVTIYYSSGKSKANYMLMTKVL